MRMVEGRLLRLSCFFTCSSVLLVGICLRSAHGNPSSCQPVLSHKKVGENVELSSCLPTDGVTRATWKYKDSIIADKEVNLTREQFKGRSYLNPTNFSLTVRRVTVQDSGDFTFISAVGDKQRATVTVTLTVHEPIMVQPNLFYNSTWNPLNRSCTVHLECRTTEDGHIGYKWAVRNQTTSGPWLRYVVGVQDGDTEFSCTVDNFVSAKSKSTKVKCKEDQPDFVLLLGVAAGGCFIVVVLFGFVLYVCHCKRSHKGSDANDLTVYADIAEVVNGDETSCDMKPCSVYETIDNSVNSVRPPPHTVYDELQLSRVMDVSVPAYQEVGF